MRRPFSMLAAAFAGLTLSAAAGGCGPDDTESDGAGGQGAGTSVEAQLEPAPAGIRRILARQYVNSVALIFGESAAAAADPPEDIGLHGLKTIGANELSVPSTAVEKYEASARAVGEAFVSDVGALDEVLSCTPEGSAAKGCYEQFVAEVGRLVWRRNLTASEKSAIADVAVSALAEYGDYKQGIVYAVMTLLQAPEFLYVVAVGEAHPENESRRVLTPDELVTRMSFFLTDTTPTAAMLDAAQAGELDSPEALRQLAHELLSRAEAKEAMRAFFSEIYRLERLDETAKDEDLFPGWSPELAAAMKESTLRLIDDILWDDADARELMTADYAYVNDTLAPIYGLSASGSGYEKKSLPSVQRRAGLMGQAGIQALQSHVDKTSPTKRGVFVRRVLMCDSVPPPPPEVMVELPENDPENPKTMKELLSVHMEEEACKSCHELFDPVGLAFEPYDAVGAFRTEDVGQAIDPSGEQPGLGEFAGPSDVGQLLFGNDKVPECMVRNVYRHSMGHLEEEGEEVAIEAIDTAFGQAGYRFRDLLVEIVASPAFRLVGDPK